MDIYYIHIYNCLKIYTLTVKVFSDKIVIFQCYVLFSQENIWIMTSEIINIKTVLPLYKKKC